MKNKLVTQYRDIYKELLNKELVKLENSYYKAKALNKKSLTYRGKKFSLDEVLETLKQLKLNTLCL